MSPSCAILQLKYKTAFYLAISREKQMIKIQKRAANPRNTNKYRKVLQILTTQPNTEMLCKYSQHNQIQKCSANTHNTTKYRNALQILTTQPNTEMLCKSSQHKLI